MAGSMYLSWCHSTIASIKFLTDNKFLSCHFLIIYNKNINTEVLKDAWLPSVGRVVGVEQNDLLHLVEEVVTVEQMALASLQDSPCYT